MKPPAIGPDYGFGLYVHWPYCARICPYCDFNVYAGKERDTAPLVAAMCADLVSQKKWLADHPKLDSIFFGGGTPSLMAPSDLSAIISAADTSFGLKSDAEITIAANPNDVLRADVNAWTLLGINRVSVGLQSLDDAALAFLGRDHTAAAGLKALERAQAHFPNHSVDLIYARPDQSEDDWHKELSRAIALGAPHLSLYELTIEERTVFGQRAARGELLALNDDRQADLYELTQRLCETAGYSAYEISNHARARQYESRHNMIYWRGGDWIGLGPGAHGRLSEGTQRYATHAARRPADYISNPAPNRSPLSPLDQARELIAMGLRPAFGVEPERIEALSTQPLSGDVLDDLIDAGLVDQIAERIRLTPSGRLLADRITAQLAP